MDRAIFHLDIPAFPVAVERVVAPRLAGRPVVVAPSSSTRAAIVVASLEARRAGVYRGMSLARAVRICRDLIVLPPNAPLYRRASDAILKILNGYSPLLEPAGGGHVFLDMTGTTRLFGRAVDSADRIQREVRQRLRLAATLGVASNKLVSRAAARVIRPGRLYDVFPGSEAPFLAPLDVDLLPGVDLPAREILSEVNIARVRELAALDVPHLRLLFGPRAWRLYREARGIDPSPVRPPETNPAVREEETLPEDSNEDALQREALDRLAARAAARLRRLRLEAGCLRVRLCYADGVESASAEHPCRPVAGDFAVRELAQRLLDKARARRIQVRHLELTLAELRAASGQLSLFDAPGGAAAAEVEADARPRGVGAAVESEARAPAVEKPRCEGPVTGETEAIRKERRDGALTAALDRIRERFGGASVGFQRRTRNLADADRRPREAVVDERSPRETTSAERSSHEAPDGDGSPRDTAGSREMTASAASEKKAATGRSRFVHLAVRSHYSLVRGTASPEELAAAAARLGIDTLALTDTDGVYGAVRFWEVTKAAGIRPILGAEVRAPDGAAFCLAEGDAGYANLCRLLTRRHREKGFTLAAGFDRDGLIVLTPCVDLLRALAVGSGTNDLYLALTATPGSLDRLRAARALGIPPAAIGDVTFLAPGDWEMHRLLRAIALNTTRDRVPAGELAPRGAWLRPPQEMERLFSFCPEAVEHSARIAARCARTAPPWGSLIFPRFQGRDPDAAFALLRQRAEAGVVRRYGAMSETARARLDYELKIIREKRFADYFLVVEDIVRQSPRTCGRGSAAASLVSYALGITHVDPLEHDLYFDRFLNPGRKDPPDIDVDFCWDERDDILKYVFDTYGEAQAAMIANHVTLRLRAAVREVAKVWGLPAAEIGMVTSRLTRYGGPDDPEEAVRSDPLFRGLRLDPPWPEILRWARRIAGCPRNLSVHCGGVVIAPGGIDRHVPVERAAKGVPVIQWEKDQAEEAGLVKIDLLGNRSLAVIRDALIAVKANQGVDIRQDAFDPLRDPATLELMRDGKTMGVFYVESPAMRQLQQKTRRGDFAHLVIHSSMIRPAANDYIREYVRRLRGGAYTALHPILDEVLVETYGIMCYQEDVAKVAMRMAGFSTVDADGLRKVLARKWPGRRVDDYRRQFLGGARAHGVGEEVAVKVWDMIMSFSGYSFCKPHSASYAMVSFQSCYLKAHYPAEFIAAVISNQGGYYSTFAYISEARRMGLQVRLPDVNTSEKAYSGRSRDPAEGSAAPRGAAPEAPAGWLRVGLMQIKGLKEAGIAALLEARRTGGPFRSLESFLERVDIDPSDVRRLILSGCFDSIAGGHSRPAMMWRLLAHSERRLPKGRRQLALFEPERIDLPEPPEAGEEKILRDEAQTLDFLVSRHPLTLYRRELARIRHVPAAQLSRHVGHRVTTIGWLITGKLVETHKGEPMEFLSFEDTTDIYETTFFPRAYERFCRLLTTTKPFVLAGKVEEDYSAITMTVEEARWLAAGSMAGEKQPARGRGLAGAT